MQHDKRPTAVANDGGQTAMDASQRSTIQPNGVPREAEVEPQPMRQEVAHMSLEEGQQVISVPHALQDELERQNEALRQAQHSLEALGHLAGTLSHEIRNPCNSIFLHTDLLEEELEQLSPASYVQMVESLAEIKSEVTRLHDMMQDYLTLARLVDLQTQPEELGPLVEGLSVEMYDLCTARAIIPYVEGLEGLGSVTMHKMTLRHALFTLIYQALGAMPGGGTLTLRGWQEDPTVYLEVSTSGPGLPEEELARVFEP